MTLPRPSLVVLLVQAAGVGVWASAAPHGFFTTFPDLGVGARWVAGDGPYSEHLTRDVGLLFLGLLVLTAAAGRAASHRVVGLAWLVVGVPHLAYHATHRPAGADGAGSLAALALVVVAALDLAVRPAPGRRDPARAPRETVPA